MQDSQGYSVYTVSTAESYPLPPFTNHLAKEDTRDIEKRPIFSTGWYAGCIFGILCLVFILCVCLIPKHGYLQRQRPATLASNWTKQGSLQVYPGKTSESWSAPGKTYIIVLKSESDFQLPIQQLQDIYSSYSQKQNLPIPYVLCEAQHPTAETPCYFGSSFLGRSCTPETKFGYRIVNGTMDPCFVIRIENSSEWTPETIRGNITIPDYTTVGCQAYSQHRNFTMEHKVNLFPDSGFLLRFFPASDFNPNLYIPPAVMVQVEKVPLGVNVTVTCWLNALNAFHLVHNGKISVIFTNQTTEV